MIVIITSSYIIVVTVCWQPMGIIIRANFTFLKGTSFRANFLKLVIQVSTYFIIIKPIKAFLKLQLIINLSVIIAPIVIIIVIYYSILSFKLFCLINPNKLIVVKPN